MNVEVIREPEPTPIKEVVLRLTNAEAKHLFSVFGRIAFSSPSGSNEETNEINQVIYKALAAENISDVSLHERAKRPTLVNNK